MRDELKYEVNNNNTFTKIAKYFGYLIIMHSFCLLSMTYNYYYALNSNIAVPVPPCDVMRVASSPTGDTQAKVPRKLG